MTETRAEEIDNAPPAPMEMVEDDQARRDLVDRIEGLLDNAQLEEAERVILELHSADLADLLEQLGPDDRRLVIGLIRPQLSEDPEFLTHLGEAVRVDVLDLLSPEEVARALTELDSDDALYVVEDLDEEKREAVLARLPTSERKLVEEGLTFPEYSAGRLMQREMVAVPMFWTVGKTIDFLRESEDLPEDFYLIIMVDPRFRPVGGALLSRILRSRRSIKLADLMDEDLRVIPADMDQEEVGFLFRQYSLVSAPVVDENGRLLGVITVDDVVDVIQEENEEDLLKLGGVQEEDRTSTVWETTRRRSTWLGVNLLTAVLASAVIGLFETTIAEIVALAVLMPIVASMGGNAGTQTLTVTVRGLATKEISGRNARRLIMKELAVGLLNGVIFALVGAAVAWAWFGDPILGGIIGLAMVITLIVAALSGGLIPMALTRLNIDPAIASGVFLTTVTDVVGFFTFLGLAAWIIL